MTQEVEQGTAARFEHSAYPDDVTTGGMGPCTGILVFDRATRVTYGVHLPWPADEQQDILIGMLDDAATEFCGSADVWVYVSGCCFDPEAKHHKPTVVRPAVEQLIREALPAANLDFRWPPPGVTSASVTLDPDTGECDIQFNL
jgi:hypothetical protein